MKQKQKPKKPLSPQQRKGLLCVSGAVMVVLILWLLFAPGRGLLYLQQQKKQLAELEAQKEQMIQENKEMSEAIERLQSDEKYLEQVARKEYGMLKENEMVFDFAEEKKKKK